MTGARPDWVMLGMPQPDGTVMLLASKELTHAELRSEVDSYDIAESWGGWARSIPTSRTTTVTAGVREFVVIVAADYGEAFTRLWESWAPPTAARPGRGALGGRPALPTPPHALGGRPEGRLL